MAEPAASAPEADSLAAAPGSADLDQAGNDAPAAAPKKKKTYKQLQMPSYEQMMQEDMMNNCGVKCVISGVMGSLMGVAFGLFTSSMDNAHGGIEGLGVEENRPTRVVVREMLRNMRVKSLSYAKGFGTMGLLFSGSECLIEKYRAKHDKLNPVYAGCVSGALIAHSAGPSGMAMGCASFAAFSLAIEHFLQSD